MLKCKCIFVRIVSSNSLRYLTFFIDVNDLKYFSLIIYHVFTVTVEVLKNIYD